MDVSAATKLLLVFLCFSLVTNFIVSYFVLGVLVAKVMSILTGVLLLALTAYLVFFIFKSEKSVVKIALFSATTVLALAGALACFCRTKYITTYSKSSRFFLSLFTSLGLYGVLAFFWPQLLLKISSTYVQAFDVDFLQLVSSGLNLLFAVLCSLFLCIPTEYREDNFVQKSAVYTIATIVVNTVIGALAGFLLQFKAESGYASQI